MERSNKLKRPWFKETNVSCHANRPVNQFYKQNKWTVFSAAFRKDNPLCAECLKKGIIKQSHVTDHIIPMHKGGEAWDIDNMQALCNTCHNKKSAIERGYEVRH